MESRKEVITTVNLLLDITTRQDEEHHDTDNQLTVLFADPAIFLIVEENLLPCPFAALPEYLYPISYSLESFLSLVSSYVITDIPFMYREGHNICKVPTEIHVLTEMCKGRPLNTFYFSRS